MPSWDVTLSLPVVTEEYSFRDMADDEDFLQVTGDSLEIRVKEPITELSFESKLSLSADSENFGVSLGSFQVDSIGAGHVTFTLGELWDDAPGSGVSMEVIPFCFPDSGGAPLTRTVDMGDSYGYIEFTEGSLLVTVRNGLPVSLGDPAAGCPFRITVVSGGDYTDSCVAGEAIGPGCESTFELDLGGSRITRDVEVTIVGGSTGSDGVVLISPDDEIEITVMPVAIRAARALARIPEQVFRDTTMITIEDSTRFVSAEIATGSADFALTNELPVALTLHVETGNVTLEGAPLVIRKRIDALSDSTVTVDLSGYRIETAPVAGDTLEGSNEIDFDVRAELHRQNDLVDLSAADTISVYVTLDELVMTKVTGILKPTVVTFSEEQRLEFPEGFECISPYEAELVINITNTAMVGGRFTLDVEGERGTTLREACFDGVIEAAESEGVSQTTRCEYSGEDAIHLIGIFPEVVRIEGEATVWGRGTISVDDSLHGDLEMIVPLVFEVRADTFTTTPRMSDIDKGVRDGIEEGIEESRFSGHVITTAPLSGGVRLFMGADSATVYSEPLLVLPGDGYSIDFDGTEQTQDGDPEFEIDLGEDELEVFMRDHLWFGLEMRLDSSDGGVTLRPDDAVRIEGKIEVVRRVGS